MNEETYRAVRAAAKPLREQRDCWKQVAVGLLVLSIMCNAVLFIIHFDEQKRWKETEESLRADLLHAEGVRDHAVKELERMANDYALEEKERQEQIAAYEELGCYQYKGVFTVTAYCPCSECCGAYADGLTSTGIPAREGIVAVDPNIIPLGSTIMMDGIKYLAADTGVIGNHIDIYMPHHKFAEAYGKHFQDVWVVEE